MNFLRIKLCLGLLLPLLAAAVFGAQPKSPVISIEGADEQLAGNIRNHLRIGREACDTPLVRLERLRNQVLGNIQRGAHALGYYRYSASLQFSRSETCWQLLINLESGEPILVNEVSVHLPDNQQIQQIFSEALADVPAMAGVPLHHGEYEAVKNDLSAVAVENGFFAAAFTRSEIRVDMTTNTAGKGCLQPSSGNRHQSGKDSSTTCCCMG